MLVVWLKLGGLAEEEMGRRMADEVQKTDLAAVLFFWFWK